MMTDTDCIGQTPSSLERYLVYFMVKMGDFTFLFVFRSVFCSVQSSD